MVLSFSDLCLSFSDLCLSFIDLCLSFSDLCQPAIHSWWELKQLAAVRFQAVCGPIPFILLALNGSVSNVAI
jgi:hypothetical protein